MNDREDVVAIVRRRIMGSGWAGTRQELSVSERLLDTGVIDSVGLISLVAFLEEHFGIDVDDEDLLPENFASLGAIADFVVGKEA